MGDDRLDDKVVDPRRLLALAKTLDEYFNLRRCENEQLGFVLVVFDLDVNGNLDGISNIASPNVPLIRKVVRALLKDAP